MFFKLFFSSLLVLIFGLTILSVAIFDVNFSDGRLRIIVEPRVKATVHGTVVRIKKRIYLEATEHNPEGDVLPDEIDDKIIKEIRETVN